LTPTRFGPATVTDAVEGSGVSSAGNAANVGCMRTHASAARRAATIIPMHWLIGFGFFGRL
jgi:hypothetical protein